MLNTAQKEVFKIISFEFWMIGGGIYQLFSFKQLIKEPTRVTFDTAMVIDHVATICPRNIMKSGVHEVSLSDHYMVYCSRKFNGAIEKSHKTIKTRKVKHFNEGAFLADVSGIRMLRTNVY